MTLTAARLLLVNKTIVEIALKLEIFTLLYFLFLSAMTTMRQGVNLQPYNTFGLSVVSANFCEIGSEKDFLGLLSTDTYKSNKRLVLGGGSNILFLNDYNGLVIKNNFRGID